MDSKFLLFITFLEFFAICLAQNYEDLDLESAWVKYKDDFGKNYEQPEEELQRKEIFTNTLKRIIEHNKKYENGETTYKMGVNKFADWKPEEKQHLYGVRGKPKYDSAIGAV